jgi:hypothetical protein
VDEEVDDVKGDIAAAFGDPEPEKEPETPPLPEVEEEKEDEPVVEEKPAEEGGDKELEAEQRAAAAAEKPRTRAPESWKPAIREHWEKLPPEVQGEINRRERDTASALQQSAEARRFAQEFQTAVRPFEGFIAAERSTPLAAFTNLMQTAAQLRIGTPVQKATVVQNIIKQYGIDIQTLDSLLAGEMPQPDNGIARLLDERLMPIQNFIQNFQGQNQQRLNQTQQEVTNEIDAFAKDPANEFFEDVRDEMATLMRVEAERGRTMTIKQAYDRAIMFTPEVAEIVEKRKAAAQAQKEAERISSKKAAGSSIRGTSGAGATASSRGGSIREDLEAAFSGGRV